MYYQPKDCDYSRVNYHKSYKHDNYRTMNHNSYKHVNVHKNSNNDKCQRSYQMDCNSTWYEKKSNCGSRNSY